MRQSRLASSALFLALLASPLAAQIARQNSKVYLNYDLRDPELQQANGLDGAATARRYRTSLPAARAQRLMRSAAAEFLAGSPAREIEWNRAGSAPEIVGTLDPARLLTPDSTAERESIARDFLQSNRALYGLAKEEVAALVKSTDYTNPAGNLSWVEFRQELLGLPIFQGEIRFAFTRNNALARTTGNLVPALDATTLNPKPRLSPAAATAAAAKSIGYTLDVARLATKSVEEKGRIQTLAKGPFVRDTRTELLWFSPAPGVAVLAYGLTLWERVDAYYLLVDANDGTLLWRKNITDHQTQPATYGIYTGASPAPMAPSTTLPGLGLQAPGVNRTLVTVIGNEAPNTFNSLGWITDGGNVTTGNNVNAGLDIDGSNGIDSGGQATGSPTRVFDFSYSPPPLGADAPTLSAYRSGATTNLFYWSNVYHDRLYRLGFTEAARNFQTNNFGRGGSGNDAVRAEVQDSGGVNNANFSTPGDGSAPRMQMYIFNRPTPNRDGSLDADVFIHELTHGTSNRLHNNGSGLTNTLAGGMGEGWSDFYARAILSNASEDVNAIFPTATYVSYQVGTGYVDNYYYGLRRFPYAVLGNVGSNGKPHYPFTLADMDPARIQVINAAYPRGPVGAAGANEVHNIGEIWCMLLLEFRARLINRLGWEVGNERALQIVTDGMKLDGTNPTPIVGRNSLITAAQNGNPGAVGLADANDVRLAFASRGAGQGAAFASQVVTESYLPDLVPASVTVTDALGNNDGIAQPGEDVVVSVGLNNPGAAAISATGTLGAASADFGSIAPGATVSRTFNYRIPANTPCGTLLTLPLNITTALGAGKIPHRLRVGTAAPAAPETFESASGSTLPAGWTSTVAMQTNGQLGTPWAASATVVDAGQSVFSPDLAGTATAGGEASLVSPVLAIPNAPTAVSFKHRWTFESGGFDGGVLEISIAGGAFTDILVTGGYFVQGGYNGTILSSSATQPLHGKGGWINTGAITTTVVDLPPTARGQNVQLRWRLGFDSGGSATGWFVDTVSLVAYACAEIDTDHDGIPNGWEAAYGLNPANASDAAAVNPLSGNTYLDDYLAGVNPNDRTTFLRIVSESVDPGTGAVTIAFQSVNGRSYTVERSTDLGGSWTPWQTGVAGTGAVVPVVDPTPGVGQTFYRVRVE